MLGADRDRGMSYMEGKRDGVRRATRHGTCKVEDGRFSRGKDETMQSAPCVAGV